MSNIKGINEEMQRTGWKENKWVRMCIWKSKIKLAPACEKINVKKYGTWRDEEKQPIQVQRCIDRVFTTIGLYLFIVLSEAFSCVLGFLEKCKLFIYQNEFLTRLQDFAK